MSAHTTLPDGIFVCPECATPLPSRNTLICLKCQHEVRKEDSIFIFTDDPDLKLDGDEIKYFGYEHIGAAYDAAGNCTTWEIFRKLGVLVSEILDSDGICLDLGAGTGIGAIPISQAGRRVIAGDISRAMLTILVNAAQKVGALQNIVACRMNAFAIPISSNSVDVVVVNELLHLVSEPERVVNEAKRVLKPEGCLITYSREAVESASASPNTVDLFRKVTHSFHHEYWDMIRKRGQQPTSRLGWFGRNIVADKLAELFAHRKEYFGDEPTPYTSTYTIGEYLHRLKHLGFSDQVQVDRRISDEVFIELESRFKKEYGSEYASIADTASHRPGLWIYWD